MKFEGTVTGREIDFRYTWLRNGKAWFDLSKDGKTIEGAGLDDGSNSWYERKGRKASEFVRHAPLKAGRSSTVPPRTCSPTASAPPRATRRAMRRSGRRSSSSTGRT